MILISLGKIYKIKKNIFQEKYKYKTNKIVFQLLGNKILPLKYFNLIIDS